MNSYNENLRTSVVTTLRKQQWERKVTKGKLRASMVTLYYAEGATITAGGRLAEAQKSLEFKERVKGQAIQGNNVSSNLQLAEGHASQYLKRSVTNATVAASNVQIAATAIVKLASDLGSVFSIVNAADFDTDIYKLAESARDYMNDTAYTAEVASQLAMEATMLTSEVSFPTVDNCAKITGALMADLLKIVSNDYNTAAQTVTDDNIAMAARSEEEKRAEGVLEDASADYQAVNAAYEAISRGLNVGLTAVAGKYDILTSKKPPETRQAFLVKNTENTAFTFMFNFLESPFDPFPGLPKNTAEPRKDAPYWMYPVREYRVIVVKDSNKTTFSLSAAESLLAADLPYQCIPVTLPQVRMPDISMPGGTTYDVVQSVSRDENTGGQEILDADGDIVVVGTGYVVFLMAVLMDDYKKKLNNFDDFLSAPSNTFHMTNILHKAKDIEANEKGNALKFQAKDEYPYKVEYRCMLLPLNDQVQKEMLTTKLLGQLDTEVSSLQQIADDYDIKIAAAEEELVNAAPYLLKMPAQDVDAFKKMSDAYHPLAAMAKSELVRAGQELHNMELEQANAKDDTGRVAVLSKQREEKRQIRDSIQGAYEKLAKLVEEKAAKLIEVQMNVNEEAFDAGTPPFFFNLELTENVPSSNYCLAKLLRTDQIEKLTGEVNLGPGQKDPSLLTDCFGNLLVDKKKYLPVVLSFAIEPEEAHGQFTNVISSIYDTPEFIYNEPIITNTVK